MANDNYKILVLSDLKSSVNTILKSSVGLAKMINGSLDFFHVKSATDVVERENQLSAMRSINGEYRATKKKIQNLINTFSVDYDIDIKYAFAFGNVKNEIGEYIKKNKPDIIVIGKKNSKQFNIPGDNITGFVLTNHAGEIMIVSRENALEPYKKLSLGLFNGTENTNVKFSKDLLVHTQDPLRLFKIVNKKSELKSTPNSLDTKTIEYVFEENDNAINNLSNYLLKSNVNLLCIDRNKEEKTIKNKNIKDFINKLNVSLLLSSNKKQQSLLH